MHNLGALPSIALSTMWCLATFGQETRHHTSGFSPSPGALVDHRSNSAAAGLAASARVCVVAPFIHELIA